jgi:hypothetical protein
VGLFERSWTAGVWVGFVTALLILVAFFPTLVFDYAPQDQLRAFRYSVAAEDIGFRAEACVSLIHSFYIMTGRPLVWPAECIEHAFVATVGDFVWLRPIALGALLVSTFALGLVLAPIFGSRAAGIVIAGLAILSPAIAFMYYQGLTGAPVNLCIFLTSVSFLLINRGDAGMGLNGRRSLLLVGSGIGLFITSCLIYPTFSFIWVPLALLYFGFDPRLEPRERFWRAARTGAYYTVGTLAYFIVAKAVAALLVDAAERATDLGQYNLAADFSIPHLYGRLVDLAGFVLNDAPLGLLFGVPWPIKVAILFLPALFIARSSSRSPLWLLTYVAATAAAIVVGVLPWMLSGFEGVTLRHSVTAQFLLVLSGAVLLYRTWPFSRQTFGVAALIVLLIPMSLVQMINSVAEIQRSEIELRLMRQALQRLVDSGEIARIRQFHVIRPDGPFYVYGSRAVGAAEFGQSALVADLQHPYQMLVALLRELLPDDALRSLAIKDCRFDRECVIAANEFGNALALSQSNAGEEPYLLHCSYVLDYRAAQQSPHSVTHPEPVPADCKPGLFGFRIVSPQSEASTHTALRAFDGSAAPDDFWETTVSEPVVLDFAFETPRPIQSYQFSPGEDTSRRPIAWRLEASADGQDWVVIDDRDLGLENGGADAFATSTRQSFQRYRFVFERSSHPQLLRIYEVMLD